MTQESPLTHEDGGALIANAPLKYYHGRLRNDANDGTLLADDGTTKLTYAYVGETENG